MIPIKTKSADKVRKELLECYGKLGDGDRSTLLSFAQFLASREPQVTTEPVAERPSEPVDISRPENETVVAAIKRLTATYPMLDRKDLLNETSSLMAAHVLQGRKALDVVDELEEIFRHHYDLFLSQKD